jgi:hypothetical protein
VTFDETGGSQKKQVNVEIVGNEEAPSQDIKKLAIGDVKPIKVQDEDEDMIVHVHHDQQLIICLQMDMVKLLHQETIMMEGQMMHKVVYKMVLSMLMNKLKLNSMIKKEVKTTLHKSMVLVLQ